MLKSSLKRIFAGLGYEVRRKRAEGWDALPALRRRFAPRTLFDVGVAHGTPSLYEAFPEAYLVLIEPLSEYVSSMRRLLAERPGRCFLKAVGEAEGRVSMTVDRQRLAKSSLLTRRESGAANRSIEEREVVVTTLDALQADYRFEPPFGLKLDTEGYELRALQGATEVLRQTDFVIAEVSVAPRFEDGYSLPELVATLDRGGFRLADILRLKRTSSCGDLAFVDALFTKQEAPATVE